MQEQDQNQIRAAALIVAAGSGVRAGLTQGRPKQYCFVGGETVLRRSINAFATHPQVEKVIVVIRDGDLDLYHESVEGADYGAALLPPVVGGATRQLSVKAGLEALAGLSPDAVLIHDAARPFISASCISETLAALQHHDGAIAAAPVTDTLKRGDAGRITETVSRSSLWRAETPQVFHFAKILAAHRAAAESNRTDFTDDASIAEWRGLDVALIENTSGNMKITTAEDLHLANLIATGAPAAQGLIDVRSGTGFDVHAFEDGDHVTLCGIEISHTHGLKGHSDADVGLHALTDALLGTIGAGDIGDHFPPSDPQWRGAELDDLFASRGEARGRARRAHHKCGYYDCLRAAENRTASRGDVRENGRSASYRPRASER